MSVAVPVALAAEPPDAVGSAGAVSDVDRRMVLRDGLKSVARGFGTVLTGLAVVVALWIGFIHLFHINPLVAKSPWAVVKYFYRGGYPSEPSSQVWNDLGRTLSDSGTGYVSGLAAAIIVALSFVLFRSLEQAFMPIAVTIRSVPLVAMTPLLTLVFGRALLGTMVISGIVVFFPALVTVVYGLRSTPKQAADLVRAFGGNRGDIVRKVMVPSALPAVFAAARVAVPGSLIGGLLAEWLATGKGLGALMLDDSSQFNYDQLWASVTILTLVSVAIYYLVGAVEAVVLARFGQSAPKH